ncbi:MAG TPA: hypothetical protein VGR08_09225 [Thermomicrobiales bacterium]|nr:hypothetical protein [Thermomicrobiales bacterium]
MEVISLHPFDPEIAQRYVAALTGEASPDPMWEGWWNEGLVRARQRAQSGDETALNQVTLGLAWALGSHHPSFVHDGFGLTVWEARIDRGVGMLLRPPSRLFADAGLDVATARTMPIRLDVERGLMGGAYVPARLIDNLQTIMETRFDRTVRRLAEAGYDPVRTMGLMTEAVTFAQRNGMGLYEAIDAVGPDGQAMPGMRLIEPDPKRLSKDLRQRIALAQKPPKREGRGLLDRVFRRHTAPLLPGENGHRVDAADHR